VSDPPIDMEALVLAWEDDSPGNAYYLDKESGNVELVQQGLYDLRDLTDEIECHRERYLYVPKPSPGQLRQDLLDFAGTVTDPRLARLLDVALESPTPLQAVRSVLSGSAGECDRWEEFRNSRVRLRVRQWLSANMIAREQEIEDFTPPE